MMYSVVSDPTPTTSVALGVTPVGGSASAGPAASATRVAAAADPARSLLSMRILFPSSSSRRPRESNHHFPQPAGRKPTYPSFTVALLAHKRTVRDGLLMFCLTRGIRRMKTYGSRRE